MKRGEERGLKGGQGLHPLRGCRLAAGLAVVAALAAAPSGSHAADYALVEGTAALRADLAWLVDRRVLSLPLATWPLPDRTVRDAIAQRRREGLSAADEVALSRVEAALARARWPARAFAAVDTGRHPDLAGERWARGRFAAGFDVQGGGDAVGGRLALSVLHEPLAEQASGVVLDGSYVAAGHDGLLAWAGVVDRHWGPGVFASPLLSSAAPAVPAVVLRRVSDAAPQTSWLRWVGPWGYEASLGRMQQFEPARTLLFGLRLYMRPVEGIEIGAARSIQWGGDGQPKGLDALWDVLWGRTAEDDDRDQDPGNEVAGFDLRWSGLTAAGTPWVLHGQLVGEDVSRLTPLKYFGTLGAQFKPAAFGARWEWTFEWTDTIYGGDFDPSRDDGCAPAYRHDTYVDGYYHRRLPLGATIGGGGRSVQVGLAWVPEVARGVDRVGVVGGVGQLNRCGDEPLHAAFSAQGRLEALSLLAEGGGDDWRWTLGASLQDAPGDPRPVASLVGRVEFRLKP